MPSWRRWSDCARYVFPVTPHTCSDTEHDEQRKRRRPPPVEAELPVEEGRQHGDGAVGEVEDARGGVGHDQAGRGDAVDAAGDEPEDRVLQELVQGAVLRV